MLLWKDIEPNFNLKNIFVILCHFIQEFILEIFGSYFYTWCSIIQPHKSIVYQLFTYLFYDSLIHIFRFSIFKYTKQTKKKNTSHMLPTDRTGRFWINKSCYNIDTPQKETSPSTNESKRWLRSSSQCVVLFAQRITRLFVFFWVENEWNEWIWMKKKIVKRKHQKQPIDIWT